MQSIGGKRLVCPSGEQIVNGGFETGDFTGWTKTGTFEVVTYLPYEGTYSARTARNESGSISQNLLNPVPVACLGVGSVFQLYWSGETQISPPGASKIKIVIGYTDGTDTTINLDFPAGEEDPDKPWYCKVDLKPYLETGKTVKSITVTLTGYAATLPYVDAISCVPKG
jgi:hypothetical protein